MNSIANSPGGATRRPDRSELAAFAERLRSQLPPVSEVPGVITTIDAGHLAHSLGTGANLTLPSAVVTGDILFAPDLNPAFFYSWDVHAPQSPDWFRVSLRFTPSDFGITDTRTYDIGWVVAPFFLDEGAVLTAETSTGQTANWTLDQPTVQTLHLEAGPVAPGDTLHVDLVRGSSHGSWIWLQTVVAHPPLTTEP